MNDEELKDFLKSNAPTVPVAPLGESSRIWRHISTVDTKRKIIWRWAPLLATSLALIAFFQMQRHVTEVKVEEEYLHQEWSDLMSDVNSDFEAEMITTFEK